MESRFRRVFSEGDRLGYLILIGNGCAKFHLVPAEIAERIDEADQLIRTISHATALTATHPPPGLPASIGRRGAKSRQKDRGTDDLQPNGIETATSPAVKAASSS